MNRLDITLFIEAKINYLYSVKIVDGGLYFIFLFSAYFIFIFLSFIFLFLEQLGLGLIGHAVISVTRLITRLGRT